MHNAYKQWKFNKTQQKQKENVKKLRKITKLKGFWEESKRTEQLKSDKLTVNS